MQLSVKLEYAKKHVESIARHDDASLADVYSTLNALVKAVKVEREAMAKRRSVGFLARLKAAYVVLFG